MALCGCPLLGKTDFYPHMDQSLYVSRPPHQGWGWPGPRYLSSAKGKSQRLSWALSVANVPNNWGNECFSPQERGFGQHTEVLGNNRYIFLNPKLLSKELDERITYGLSYFDNPNFSALIFSKIKRKGFQIYLCLLKSSVSLRFWSWILLSLS